MEHELKIEPQYLKNLLSGKKKVEIRYNDRDYQVGDVLVFWNESQDDNVYFKITHIHSGLGMADRYVALSVKQIPTPIT